MIQAALESQPRGRAKGIILDCHGRRQILRESPSHCAAILSCSLLIVIVRNYDSKTSTQRSSGNPCIAMQNASTNCSDLFISWAEKSCFVHMLLSDSMWLLFEMEFVLSCTRKLYSVFVIEGFSCYGYVVNIRRSSFHLLPHNRRQDRDQHGLGAARMWLPSSVA